MRLPADVCAPLCIFSGPFCRGSHDRDRLGRPRAGPFWRSLGAALTSPSFLAHRFDSLATEAGIDTDLWSPRRSPSPRWLIAIFGRPPAPRDPLGRPPSGGPALFAHLFGHLAHLFPPCGPSGARRGSPSGVLGHSAGSRDRRHAESPMPARPQAEPRQGNPPRRPCAGGAPLGPDHTQYPINRIWDPCLYQWGAMVSLLCGVAPPPFGA